MTDAKVTIQAPAKLNLGLEVIGKRDDGYHEIVTILQAVSIYDTLSLTRGETISVSSSDPALNAPDNLVTVALSRLRQATGASSGASAWVEKHIPIAAGLGGASSDAAAALLAGRAFWQSPVTDQALAMLAAEIGSDVPFFLVGGSALGTGRGDQITSLPALRGVWFVIVSPEVVIERKTATLYQALERQDFSDGRAVRAYAQHLASPLSRATTPLPPNAFSRPLYALHSELSTLPEHMAAAGATMIGLSGAGPSHFAIFTDRDRAEAAKDRLERGLGNRARVLLAAPVINPPAPVST